MSSLAPVPSDSQTCSNCGAGLVADQRYCLSCGQPCSPVRLAFLDVLSSDQQPQLGAATVSAAPVAYAQYIEPAPGPAWLRRYAPLLAVVSVLLLAMIVGLLVGHWVTQSKAPAGPQVIKVDGLSAAAGTGAAAAATTPTTATTTPAAAAKTNPSSSKEEKQEEAEAKAEEAKKVAAPAPVKVSSSTLTKIEKSTGRKHQEELNKIGTAPIAVP